MSQCDHHDRSLPVTLQGPYRRVVTYYSTVKQGVSLSVVMHTAVAGNVWFLFTAVTRELLSVSDLPM